MFATPKYLFWNVISSILGIHSQFGWLFFISSFHFQWRSHIISKYGIKKIEQPRKWHIMWAKYTKFVVHVWRMFICVVGIYSGVGMCRSKSYVQNWWCHEYEVCTRHERHLNNSEIKLIEKDHWPNYHVEVELVFLIIFWLL